MLGALMFDLYYYVIGNISYNCVVHVMALTQMWTEMQQYIIYLVGCSQESSAAGKQTKQARVR